MSLDDLAQLRELCLAQIAARPSEPEPTMNVGHARILLLTELEAIEEEMERQRAGCTSLSDAKARPATPGKKSTGRRAVAADRPERASLDACMRGLVRGTAER
jgi:hypothetical protein